ncbi:MAG: energy transducer TonB, partial [bacterium]
MRRSADAAERSGIGMGAMRPRFDSLTTWMAVSIGIHALLFGAWADQTFPSPSPGSVEGPKTVQVALRLPAPTPAPIPSEIPTPAPLPEPRPVAEPPPTPPAEPARREPPPPAPPPSSSGSVSEAPGAAAAAVEAPSPLPLPAAEPAAEPVAEPVAEPAKPTELAAVAEASAPSQTSASAAAPASSVEESTPPAVSSGVPASAPSVDPLPDYVAEIRARIEREKRYPSMARRRGDEGRVLARVAIAASGELDSVDVEGQASVLLLRATRDA